MNFACKLVLGMWLFLFAISVCIAQEDVEVVVKELPSEEIYSIDEIVNIVLANSPEIRMADEDIKRAIREYKTAKTYYLPRLTLQGSAGVDLFHVDEFDDNDLGLNLILDWDFFRNGMLIFRVAQARAKMEEAKLNKLNLEMKITMETKQLVLDLMIQKDLLGIEKLEVEREKEKLKRLEIRVEQGEAKQTDATRHRVNLFEKEQRFLKKEQEFFLVLGKFKRKSKFQGVINVDYETFEPLLFNDLSVELCEQIALENVPQNRINEMTYELAKKGAKLARWKRWPQIELFAGNAFALSQLTDESNQFQLQTGVIVRYPIYDGGEIKNQILLAELQEERAKLVYEQGMDDIKDQVKEAYLNVVGQEALFKAASMQFEILEKDKKQTNLEYESGNVSKFDYEETLMSLQKAELRTKTAYFDLLKAYVKLENKLGVKKLTPEFIQEEKEQEEQVAGLRNE